MPDGRICNSFQTKDLSCELNCYEVGDDFRLRKIEYSDYQEGMGAKLLSPEDQDYDGWLTFYGYDASRQWSGYRAEFRNGRLIEIQSSN